MIVHPATYPTSIMNTSPALLITRIAGVVFATAGAAFLIHHHQEKNASFDQALEIVVVIIVVHSLVLVLDPTHKALRSLFEKFEEVLGEVKELNQYIREHVKFTSVARPQSEDAPTLMQNFAFDAHVLQVAKPGDTIYIVVTYVANFKAYLEEFKKVLAEGVKFRILILHPDSSAVAARAEQIRKPIQMSREDYQHGIDEFVTIISDCIKTTSKENTNGAIQIHYQNTPPCGPKYMIETKKGRVRRILQGFYLDTVSSKGAHLLWLPGMFKEQVESIQSHIHNTWESQSL